MTADGRDSALPRDPRHGRGGGHEHGPDCCGHDHGAPATIAADALISGRDMTVNRNGRSLIERVSLAIAPAEIVTLIGPNGAGKSTLVRAMLGLEPLSSGSIARKPGLRIGYVPQRFDIDPTIPLQVNRFLTLGTADGTWDISATLGEVGAPHLLREEMSKLSGGELQRVLLARALLRRPDLLVLDEPVRGLDHLGEAAMYDLIAAVRDVRRTAVLLVSHDLTLVMAKTDRVLCLNRHVCCSGRPEAVAAHPAYAQLFGAEAARAFAVYTHRHDHTHDATGAPVVVERGANAT
ncbi:MAG: ATP-binding cassette domain-containing protein [Hyphomicrobiaceae bacterium]|nr:ATP-binding cassette domain-containing protein [Hyphomicrobiaceae bacterium]